MSFQNFHDKFAEKCIGTVRRDRDVIGTYSHYILSVQTFVQHRLQFPKMIPHAGFPSANCNFSVVRFLNRHGGFILRVEKKPLIPRKRDEVGPC